MLTLCQPAPAAVRARGVLHAPTAVLQPWLEAELTQILAALPPPPLPEPERPPAAQSAPWRGHEPRPAVPPLRRLVWDNLAGHLRWVIVDWLMAHGIMPLYTPISGSWLNMAASVQRSLVRRALAGQQPPHSAAVIPWLEETGAGWHAAPTPFVWGGKRQARRQRARQRRGGGSGAARPGSHIIAA